MNTDDTPIELLEAQRRIRAAQIEIKARQEPTAGSLDGALASLRKTLEAVPRIPDAKFDVEANRKTVEQLRAGWNAPTRHVSRTDLDNTATEWNEHLSMLWGRIGRGFTCALVGVRGPGKTQMAVELMRHVTEQRRSAYYCTAMDYFMRIKDAFHHDRKETQADAQKFFSRFSFLVLDEVNVRSDSAWEDNMLADLIGKRYNALLDTILISNETAAQFEKSIGPSIIDRLNETGGIVECTWRSFRA